MHHSFGEFLRHGGDGQYVIAQQDGRLAGSGAGLSLKSTFPNHSALRADFSDRLDKVIAENTRMLLNALTPPDAVPVVDAAPVLDAAPPIAAEAAPTDDVSGSVSRFYYPGDQP